MNGTDNNREDKMDATFMVTMHSGDNKVVVVEGVKDDTLEVQSVLEDLLTQSGVKRVKFLTVQESYCRYTRAEVAEEHTLFGGGHQSKRDPLSLNESLRHAARNSAGRR